MARPKCFPSELCLDAGWAIGEKAFAKLLVRIADVQPKTILEFGGGISTVRLAMAFPHVNIVSIESDTQVLQRTKRLLAAYVEHHHTSIVQRPLSWQRWGAGLYASYAPISSSTSVVDVVLIDGPPHRTQRGREACLYQVAHRLRGGSLVILDDLVRSSEQKICENWQRIFPGTFDLSFHDVGHHLAFLKVLKQPKPHWLNLKVICDNALVLMKLLKHPRYAFTLRTPVRVSKKS